MTEAGIVRFGLVLYALTAAGAILLIWHNAAAGDALKNAGIAIASSLPLLLAVLPYLIRGSTSARFDFILIYDSKDKSFTTGTSWNAYASDYMHMFTNLGQVPDALTPQTLEEAMQQKGLDIIEKGIVEAMQEVFSNWWDMEVSEHPGPAMVGRNYQPKSTGPKTVLTLEKIRTIFPHNTLIKHPDILVMPTLVLPPDTQITAKPEDNRRTIVLKNRFTENCNFHACNVGRRRSTRDLGSSGPGPGQSQSILHNLLRSLRNHDASFP